MKKRVERKKRGKGEAWYWIFKKRKKVFFKEKKVRERRTMPEDDYIICVGVKDAEDDPLIYCVPMIEQSYNKCTYRNQKRKEKEGKILLNILG